MKSDGFIQMINTDPILNPNPQPVQTVMYDCLGNKLDINDVVLFPGGRELMKGTITKIKHLKFASQAYVENESGYSKWKYTCALVKVFK